MMLHLALTSLRLLAISTLVSSVIQAGIDRQIGVCDVCSRVGWQARLAHDEIGTPNPRRGGTVPEVGEGGARWGGMCNDFASRRF